MMILGRIKARCENCDWTWSGRADLFGKGDEILLSALNRLHYENPSGSVHDPPCEQPRIHITQTVS